MRFTWKYITSLLFIAFFASCNGTKNKQLTIACAANMQFALDEIVTAFEEESGVKCKTIISSSGKLTAQIMEGAPYDIFLSADMNYPSILHENKLTKSEPKLYGYGKLVIWTMTDSIEPTIEALDDDNISHISIANPAHAPYGRAAREIISHYNLGERLKGKLVNAESISQTNHFITTGSAQIGFTSKSTVLSPKMAEKGKWKELPQSIYRPLPQGVVILTDNGHALKFQDFLFSQKGKEILKAYGYSPAE